MFAQAVKKKDALFVNVLYGPRPGNESANRKQSKSIRFC